MKVSIHAQASAVDTLAVQAYQRGNLKMNPQSMGKSWGGGLVLATETLMLLDVNRHRPGIAQVLAEIEG